MTKPLTSFAKLAVLFSTGCGTMLPRRVAGAYHGGDACDLDQCIAGMQNQLYSLRLVVVL